MGKPKRNPDRPYKYAGMDFYQDQLIHLKNLSQKTGMPWSEMVRLCLDEHFKLPKKNG